MICERCENSKICTTDNIPMALIGELMFNMNFYSTKTSTCLATIEKFRHLEIDKEKLEDLYSKLLPIFRNDCHFNVTK